MKKVKKIMCFVLMFLFLCATSLTVFAAPSFNDATNGSTTQHKYFLLPLDNQAVHYSYAASDGSNSVTYEAGHRLVTPVGMTVNNEGVISFLSNATIGNASTNFYRLTARSAEGSITSGRIYTYGAYSNDFTNATISDGKISENGTDYFTDVSLETEGQNNYIKGTDGLRFYFLKRDVSSYNDIVMEFDVKLLTNFFNATIPGQAQTLVQYARDRGMMKDDNTPISGFDNVSQGWHHFKIIMNWKSLKYSVFFDNALVLNNESLKGTASSTGFRFYGADGIDNFKYYGSSLNVPYNLSVSGTPQANNILTAVADEWNGTSLVDSELEYAFFTSDTENGEYANIHSGNSYTVSEECNGKYIKAGVRVKESETIFGDWIYTTPQYVADSFEWINKINKIYTPHGNDVYKYHYTFAGGGSNKDGKLGGTTTGVALDSHGAEGYVLTVDSSAVNINTQVMCSSNTDSRAYVTITDAGIYDFENEAVETFSNNPVIMTEANGNKYFKAADYSRFEFPNDIKDTVAIDFDILSDTQNQVNVNFTNNEKIGLKNQLGKSSYKDISRAIPYTNFGTGWNHVRIYLDLTDKKYSIFIDNEPVTINNAIGGSSAAVLSSIDILGSIDNLTYANVSQVTPVVYNQKLNNAAAGKNCNVDYDFFCGGVDDLCTSFEWYISDSSIGEYTKISEEATFTPDVSQLGKYVKVKVKPATEYGFETYTGADVWTSPQFIGNLSIDNISLKINGTDASIYAANIAEQAEGETAQISLTISVKLASGDGDEAIFALAQYDNNELQNISSAIPSLTTVNEDIVLNLTASNVTETTYFKLLMFTKDELKPLNGVIFLR